MTTGRINQVTISHCTHTKVYAQLLVGLAPFHSLIFITRRFFKTVIWTLLNTHLPLSTALQPVLGQVDTQKAPNTPFSQSLEAISRSQRTKVMFLGEDYQQPAKYHKGKTRPWRNFNWLIAKWFGHRQ